MADANVLNLAPLYAELARAGENGEFEKGLKIVNKILTEDKDDKKAQHCKAVCLVHLSQFEQALSIFNKHVSDSVFEKAYCLYRLNKISEAYDTLKAIPNPEWKEKELLAQVLYRLERYDECFKAYKELIKNSDDDYEEERETNLSAVVANLCDEKGKDFKVPHLREHTYELCYNSACITLNEGDYNTAIAKLKTAEELCKKTLEENDATEEEIESELGVIRVQLGYALQLQNKNERALNIYSQVLKSKPADVAVVAVASNNIVTINKDQSIFDSKKKIRVAIADNLESKLTSKQRNYIAINHSLLLMHTNQFDQCHKSLLFLKKNFSSSVADAALVQAALFCKEKKVQKAVEVLKEFAISHPEQSVALSFTLAQLLLIQGHTNDACNTLKSMGDISYTPGVISALVTLYLNLEDRDAASTVMRDAIAWYRVNSPQNPALKMLIRESSKLELKNGRPKEAAELLEELHTKDPKDLKTLAQLISAYSQFNPEKAKQVSKKLPPITEASLHVDVNSLESTSWTMGSRYVKKGKLEPASAKQESGDGLIQKRKRKHKKGKLPKNFDPSIAPDPERWLPKQERSTYKKKKDKRNIGIGKGPQGAILSEEAAKASVSSVPSPGVKAIPTSPNVQGPRQLRGVQKKKKKQRW